MPRPPEDLALAATGRLERRLGLLPRFRRPWESATPAFERHPLPGLDGAALLLRRPAPTAAPCRGICLELGDGLGREAGPGMAELALASGLAVALLAIPAGAAPPGLVAAAAAVEMAARHALLLAAQAFGPVARLVLAGESAGAQLALATALRQRELMATGAGSHRFAGLLLRHGAYELGGPREDPSLHPLGAPLQGLPPALLIGGLQDPLLDETRLLARRMAEAGTPCELALVPEDPRSTLPRRAPSARTTARIQAWLQDR